MPREIFINLPVKNLDRSIKFFKELGFEFNPQFTDKNAACMIIEENIFAMLLTEEFFKTFLSPNKQIADPQKNTEVLLCVSADSRKEVDDIVAKAKAAGASSPRDPQDHGFMYGHGFDDLDGHIWEVMYMDMNAMKNLS